MLHAINTGKIQAGEAGVGLINRVQCLVMLAIADFETHSYGARPRAAAARVVISSEEVTSWEMALRPG
ncbi:hypothetical protein [Nonomuraea basaltis]|uniref:hypothetical protein n=1 Tax=Nonomuraea basaltis TaxID=2495887 RepID=UPI00110C6943|nr:hypothetical protein [Nonomuraea basaltis]TMR99783.1 hypothetical protein EJK15_05815 [Nonomuraea basaltis]